jgi:hypothetical protein
MAGVAALGALLSRRVREPVPSDLSR